ncbi:DUF805 domain-containing protein [Amorphus coralli]|uniref:DUF805 domain-containing protein n=1 Tax=Amorphus coralli TaxID=340680 RepID=UPI00037948CE|nr:DUF805 domain-containing protein [Amorphus coralli]
MIDSYLGVMRNYVTFSGRIARKDYWLYILAYIILLIIAGLIDGMLGFGWTDGSYYDPVSSLVSLVHLLPSLAAGFRRLHDVGRTAWWYLILLVPLIGMIVILIFHVQRGDEGPNDYGPDPRNAMA